MKTNGSGMAPPSTGLQLPNFIQPPSSEFDHESSQLILLWISRGWSAKARPRTHRPFRGPRCHGDHLQNICSPSQPLLSSPPPALLHLLNFSLSSFSASLLLLQSITGSPTPSTLVHRSLPPSLPHPLSLSRSLTPLHLTSSHPEQARPLSFTFSTYSLCTVLSSSPSLSLSSRCSAALRLAALCIR